VHLNFYRDTEKKNCVRRLQLTARDELDQTLQV